MLPIDSRTTRIDVGVVDVVVLSPVEHSGRESTSAIGSKNRWRVLTLHRAPGVRCTGAWELVHGSIEAGERPADAARREVREETGLEPERLYNLTTNAFYLHHSDTVQIAVVFVAIVNGNVPVTLGVEHNDSVWRSPTAATRVLAWPREHEAIRHAMHLLRSGDAGAAEDVLRIV